MTALAGPRRGRDGALLGFPGEAEDGFGPNGSLVAYNGNLYGATWNGGASNDGTVFAVTPLGVVTIYSFKNGSDGENPNGSLVAYGSDLWGTTANGGANGEGAIFKLTPLASGRTGVSETVAYAFGADGGAVGKYPYGGLACDKACYGTTADGGAHSDGTAFGFTPAHANVALVRAFGSDADDGFGSTAGLVVYKGALYGTTAYGGTSNNCLCGCGTVFTLRP